MGRARRERLRWRIVPTNRLGGSGLPVDKHARHVHHAPLRAIALASAERLRLCVRVPRFYLQWFADYEEYVINVLLPERCMRDIIGLLGKMN
jgi:hypothetical protein